MNDKDFLNEKLQVLDEVEIPESISPAVMMAKLKAQKAEKKTYSKITVLKRVALAAAAVALFVTGVLSIKDSSPALKLSSVDSNVENVRFFTSEKEVVAAIREYATRNVNLNSAVKDYAFYTADGATTGEAEIVYEDAAEGTDYKSAEDATDVNDFSTTNVQEEGVMEADVAITDGKYIYSLSTTDGKIRIVDLQNKENLKVVSVLDTDGKIWDSEFFVVGDRLVLNVSGYDKTSVKVYDISDRANPKLESEFSQDGQYNTSRVIDNVMYLVSVKYNYKSIYVIDGFEWISDGEIEKAVLPCVELNGAVSTIPADHTCVIGEPDSATFTVVTALDVTSGEPINTLSVVGTSGTIYCTSENLYLTRADYSDDFKEETTITKISLNGGSFDVCAQGNIKGRLLNQFSLGEYQGNLRVAATYYYNYEKDGAWYYDTENNVYVLDENLDLIGSIEGLAKGERIYSARFMGEKIYLVTFKETDPLFVIDASDPTNPVVLGELKIPGFSNYLHPYGEDMLIGLGEDVEFDEEFGVLRAKGLKLSLFDVSDPTNPIEVDAITVGGPYSYSDAQHNHKAVLFDAKRSIIGFPCQNFDNKYDCYMVFTVSENGFEPLKKVTDEGMNGYNLRGLTVGDTLFTVSINGISADDLYSENNLCKIKY